MHVPGYVTNGGRLGYYKGKNEGHFSIKNSSVSSTNIDDDEKNNNGDKYDDVDDGASDKESRGKELE